MINTKELSSILLVVLFILLFVIIILAFIYLVKKSKENKKQVATKGNPVKTNDYTVSKYSNYTKQSVFNFMEFDSIEDNMIIQKNGSRFLMVIQCQGINYDLMSANEKNAVEEGFIQFLNTLRHPIQLYVQTRTINLEDSISSYKDKVSEIEMNLNKAEMEYKQNVRSGRYTPEDLQKQFYELTKQRNLYEYGKDIIFNTERMSLNKNVLNKQYYIIIPYYSSELGSNAFDKEEVKNIAFSELYTRAQSIVRTLFASEINATILNSTELVDLLYVAYNRDDAEVYGIDKAIKAGYDELYSTAQDVLDKKMEEIDARIENDALEKAKLIINEVKTEKQKEFEHKQKELDALIDEYAQVLLEENKEYIGEDIAEESIKRISKKKTKKTKEEEVEKLEEEKAKPTRRVRNNA